MINFRTPTVGPAPAVFMPKQRQGQTNQFDYESDIKRQFHEHNLRLARSMNRSAAVTNGDGNCISANGNGRSKSEARRSYEGSSWQEDIYKDFENIYTSMVRDNNNLPSSRQHYDATSAPRRTISLACPRYNPSGYNNNNNNTVNHRDVPSIRVDECIADVETALKRVALEAVAMESSLGIQQQHPNQQQVSLLISPGQRSEQVSPSSLSVGDASEAQTTRADSRETNQSYQLGPALVEEMTLSDLEEEISSTLMATKSLYHSKQSKMNNTTHYSAPAANQRNHYSGSSVYSIRTPRNRNPLPTSISRALN